MWTQFLAAHSTALRSVNRQVVLLKPLSVGGVCNSENICIAQLAAIRAELLARECGGAASCGLASRQIRLFGTVCTHLWTVRGGDPEFSGLQAQASRACR